MVSLDGIQQSTFGCTMNFPSLSSPHAPPNLFWGFPQPSRLERGMGVHGQRKKRKKEASIPQVEIIVLVNVLCWMPPLVFIIVHGHIFIPSIMRLIPTCSFENQSYGFQTFSIHHEMHMCFMKALRFRALVRFQWDLMWSCQWWCEATPWCSTAQGSCLSPPHGWEGTAQRYLDGHSGEQVTILNEPLVSSIKGCSYVPIYLFPH